MNSDAMINNLIKYEFEDNSLLDDTNFGINQSDYICSPLNDIIREQMLKICSIWLEIGVPKSRMINRIEEVKSLVEEQVVDLFKTIEKTEKETLTELKEYRVSKLQDINKILNDLKLPLFEISLDISLVETAKLLHFKFNELNNLKKERINKWNEFKGISSQLCVQLGCENKPHNLDTGIPSEDELVFLQSYVLDLKKIKEKRSTELEEYKKKFKPLFEQIEYSPENDFESNIFHDKQFILSDSNMNQLSDFLIKLNNIAEKNQLKMKKYLEKLNSLWKKLSISVSEQELLLSLCKDAKPSTLNLMKDEIDKLEEIKRQNMGVFIQKIRLEIEELWTKCFISEEEIAEFTERYFYQADLNDELLIIHEKELERLQDHFNENEDFYNKLAKWKTYRSRFQELVTKSKDPNRYNNRGGALLQEEKERKQLQKGIGKLENEMKTMVKEWSDKHDKKFKIYGKSIDKYFSDYYEACNIQKENEKEKKKSIKKKDIETENRITKITTVANLTKKQTPLKRCTPFKSVPNKTKEKTNKIELISSFGKYNPISTSKQKRDALKLSAKKNIIKNLKSELISNANIDIKKKTDLITSFEITLLNESQFKSEILMRNDVLNSTNVTKN